MGTIKHSAERKWEPTSEPFRAPRIVIAEEDSETRRTLAAALRTDGYEVIAVANGFELLDALSSALLAGIPATRPDAIIMDIWMPGVSGLSILGGLRDAGWQMPIVLITGGFGRELRARSAAIGASAVFEKPFDIHDLRTVILNLVPGSPESGTRLGTGPLPPNDLRTSPTAC